MMKNNKILKILVPIVLVLIIFAAVGKKKGWFGKAATVKVAIEQVKKLDSRAVRLTARYSPRKRSR
jgi:hypothetical protein